MFEFKPRPLLVLALLLQLFQSLLPLVHLLEFRELDVMFASRFIHHGTARIDHSLRKHGSCSAKFASEHTASTSAHAHGKDRLNLLRRCKARVDMHQLLLAPPTPR
eukprot:411451-Rhodomonas_salina.5